MSSRVAVLTGVVDRAGHGGVAGDAKTGNQDYTPQHVVLKGRTQLRVQDHCNGSEEVRSGRRSTYGRSSTPHITRNDSRLRRSQPTGSALGAVSLPQLSHPPREPGRPARLPAGYGNRCDNPVSIGTLPAPSSATLRRCGASCLRPWWSEPEPELPPKCLLAFTNLMAGGVARPGSIERQTRQPWCSTASQSTAHLPTRWTTTRTIAAAPPCRPR
jgi:hypothetical protein